MGMGSPKTADKANDSCRARKAVGGFITRRAAGFFGAFTSRKTWNEARPSTGGPGDQCAMEEKQRGALGPNGLDQRSTEPNQRDEDDWGLDSRRNVARFSSD